MGIGAVGGQQQMVGQPGAESKHSCPCTDVVKEVVLIASSLMKNTTLLITVKVFLFNT